MDIIESFPSAYARIPQDGASDKEYWIYHGEAIPKMNDKPPWPKRDSPWAKAVSKPEVDFDQIDPDEIWNPLSGYAVHWIATALGGKQMVISTTKAADELNNNQAPKEAKLFVYD